VQLPPGIQACWSIVEDSLTRIRFEEPAKPLLFSPSIVFINIFQISAGRAISLFESFQIGFFQEDEVLENPKSFESFFPELDLIDAEKDAVGSHSLAAYHLTGYATQNRGQELAQRIVHLFLGFLYDLLADIIAEIVHGGVRVDHQADQSHQSYHDC
jgi:hypothetical protein